MTWQNALEQTLKSEFESIKKRNPQYSLRAFASKIELSPAAVSQMLRGSHKWKLTPDRGVKIINNLGLSVSKSAQLFTLMGVTPERERQEVNLENYGVLLDYRYLAVLACHDLSPEERSITKMAARLGVAVEEIERIIAELVEKKFLRKNPDTGQVEKETADWRAGDGPPSEIIRQHHKNNLQLASTAVDRVPVGERHFSTITFAGSSARIQELQKEIRSFHEKIMNLMNQEDKNDEVFRFSISIFPIRDFSTEDVTQ